MKERLGKIAASVDLTASVTASVSDRKPDERIGYIEAKLQALELRLQRIEQRGQHPQEPRADQ